MSIIKILKVTIILQWLFIILSVISGFIEESYLPKLLLKWVEEDDLNIENNFILLPMLLLLILFFLYIISSIGVFRLKQWAKKPYTLSNIMLGVIIISFGSGVYTPLAVAFDYYSTLSIGFTMALIYYTPAKNEFK